MTRLLKIKEAADRLGCSPNHVYDLINTGQLRVVDISARKTRAKGRISEDDLQTFIDSRTHDGQTSGAA